MMRAVIPALILLVMTVSCRQTEMVTDGHTEFMPFYTLDETVHADTEMKEWLEPFRRIYNREMSHPVATASGSFVRGKPESTLGNLAADMIRYRATHEMHTYVHLALISDERFMIELEEGEITLGDVYELMPYDNTLIVLELKGAGVQRLADEIAGRGGMPVSGLRMTITDGRATGILVDFENIDPDKTYYVATSSYLANGHGGIVSLMGQTARHEYPLLIRDLFIDHMRSRRVLTPVEDQRIRMR